MNPIQIYDAEKEERDYILHQLIQFNHTQVNIEQVPPYLRFSRCIKDGNEVIGGIIGDSFWNILHIEILWVKEGYRNKGYATALLTDVENSAKNIGCKISHLDTFDFQAKGLYEKFGYAVFGVLEDCPEGHNRYYMSKKLV